VAIFTRLAQAEAKIHHTSLEAIHFHEVGAVDAIVDIVSACLGFYYLGIEAISASPLVLGRGYVECQHGLLPVPAPATLELISSAQALVTNPPNCPASELTTPTGAAVITTLAQCFGPVPAMRVEQVGYGAGDKIFPQLPNALRLLIGVENSVQGEELPYEQDQVMLIETNIDNMNPEIYDQVWERLFEAGALDVFLTPIMMKKGRPANTLTVLASPEEHDRILAVIFAETSAIGVRTIRIPRYKLSRRIESVETPYGPIRIKIASDTAQKVLNISPEYEDLKSMARAKQMPLKQLIQLIAPAIAQKYPLA
jgi:uncharacterized protein (TIGR00299 family) protein